MEDFGPSSQNWMYHNKYVLYPGNKGYSSQLQSYHPIELNWQLRSVPFASSDLLDLSNTIQWVG